eukprot:gene25155-23641_t
MWASLPSPTAPPRATRLYRVAGPPPQSAGRAVGCVIDEEPPVLERPHPLCTQRREGGE